MGDGDDCFDYTVCLCRYVYACLPTCIPVCLSISMFMSLQIISTPLSLSHFHYHFNNIHCSAKLKFMRACHTSTTKRVSFSSCALSRAQMIVFGTGGSFVHVLTILICLQSRWKFVFLCRRLALMAVPSHGAMKARSIFEG